jgi:ATP-dependent protease ClpP protease subunit
MKNNILTQQGPLTLLDRLIIINDYGLNLDTATIYISGEITSALSIALRIKHDMLVEYYASINKPLKEINLIINSLGGDADAIFSTLDFYDELKKKGVLVNTKADGSCMSAATFIVCGGTGKRTATKRCRFMVHELQLAGIGGTHTQTKSLQVELDRMQSGYYETYAMTTKYRDKKPTKEQLNKEIALWEKRCAKETYFGAKEALELGLIDEIE